MLAEAAPRATGARRRGVQLLERGPGRRSADRRPDPRAARPHRSRARRAERGPQRDPCHQYLTREGASASWAGAASSTSTQGLARTIDWYRSSSSACRLTRIQAPSSSADDRRSSGWSPSTTLSPSAPRHSSRATRRSRLRPRLRRGRAQHLVDSSLDFWLTTGRFAAVRARIRAAGSGFATRARQLRLVGQPRRADRADLAAARRPAAAAAATRSSPSPPASRPRSTRSSRTAWCPVFVDVAHPDLQHRRHAARGRARAAARARS